METTQRKSVIYTLYAFDGKGPRYCGHTMYPVKRFRAHKSERNKNYKCNWVKSVGPENIHMSILEITTPEKAPEREIFYIKKLKDMGFKLTNLTGGGEGLSNISPETRAKLSAASTGHTHTDATKAKLSAIGKGRTPSEEHRKNLSKALRGRVYSPETILKMSIAKKGKHLSPETCAKISEAGKRNTEHAGRFATGHDAWNTGVPMTPEVRERLRVANIGRKASPETRLKMSIAQSNKSPETLAKISASSTGRRHTPEAKAKIAAARTGVPRSPETLAKMIIASTGRKVSPETKAKMALAQQQRRAREQREGGV
jgi:group I intron endonuclease